MPSYLDAPFLADLQGYDDTTDIAGPTVSESTPAQLPAVVDSVTLPGGIVIPKKTLWIILGIIAAVGLYLYLKNKKRSED